jgi:hypothetical protein
MFSYIIIEEGPMVQILHGTNVIDESGPWESIASASSWAEAYVAFKNSELSEPIVG